MNFRRPVVAFAVVAIGVTGFAIPASAHVTVNPNTAAPGAYTKLTFRMPNEEDSANATKLEVDLPTDHPIASVSVQPQDGWTYTVQKSTLATPIVSDDGSITQAVSQIVWTASGDGIKPGEFGEFNISAGPLPKDVDSLSFKALQTYSDGNVVRWIDAASSSGEEPAHPAPVLKLSAAATTATTAPASTTMSATYSDDYAKKGTATAALVIGIVALVLGIFGLTAGLIALGRASAARRETKA